MYLLLPLLTVVGDLQSPAEIPGLVLWLDAADPEAVALDAGRVRQWRDKSGHAHHLSAPADGARPDLAKAAQNGRNLLGFDGSSRYLAGPAVLPQGQNAYTIVALWRPRRTQGAQSIFEQATAPLTGGSRAALLAVGERYGFNGESNDRHDLVPFGPRAWRLTCLDLDHAREQNVRILDNGATYAGRTEHPEALKLGDSGVTVGRKLATDGEYFDGEVAEIAVFDRVLTRPERLRLLDWLERKWGLDLLGWFRTPDGTIVTGDFDGDTYEEWKPEGTAFGTGPAHGTLPGQMDVTGFVGTGLANSYLGGDGSTGTLTSPPLRLERRYVSFLIGGGNAPGVTCLNLLVEGQVVRTATGPNDKPGGTERLDPDQWDVADLVGKVGVLQVVDQATGGWGHLNVDEVRQTDTRMLHQVPQSREIAITDRLLNLPVRTGAPKRIVRVLAGGKPVRDFEIELAMGEPEFWTILDVSAWKGQTLRLECDRLPENATLLEGIRQADGLLGAEDLYHEKLRPQLHFTSRRGWNNDSNGLVYLDGEYHLFYQHNPYGVGWGNMHWGHAVSRDLVHWQELGEALYPDEHGTCFSGSAVVDELNTAGFGKPGEKPLVCIYCAAGNPVTQCLGYSLDRGRTFRTYEGNPVVPHLIGGNRDPKVIWYAPEHKWVMALFLDANDYGLLSSPDLKKWEMLSKVTIPGTSECPEFFEIPLDGDAKNTRWVFYGGTGDYLVGRFDGKTFTPDSGPHRLNLGNCFYASQTFNGTPDGRRIQIAWGTIGIPGMPFNQMLDFPVELTLHTTAEGTRLFANPVREIAKLHGEAKSWHDLELRPGDNPLAGLRGELWHVKLEFEPGAASAVGLNLRGTPVEWRAKDQVLACRDRSAKVAPVKGRIKLEVLCDRVGLEIWANDGERYLPMGVIPRAEDLSLGLFTRDGSTVVKSLEVWAMRSGWEGQ